MNLEKKREKEKKSLAAPGNRTRVSIAPGFSVRRSTDLAVGYSRSTLKRLNNYIVELWLNEWDSYPLNKQHTIHPNVNEHLPSCRSNRNEGTVQTAHLSFIHDSLFPGKRRKTPFFVSRNESLSLEHVLLHCSEKKEKKKKRKKERKKT